MKKIITIAVSLIILLSSSITLAATFKVGVIDMQKVLKSIPQVNTADANFKKQFMPREKKLKLNQATLAKAKASLTNSNSTMTKAMQEAAQEKIDSQQSDLQISQAQYAQDMQNAQARAMRQILRQISQKVNQVAKKGGYDLVLAKSSTIYYKNKYDITNNVIAAMKT